MKTVWLRARAPFAAYRWMQAGVYRATSPVMPPTAAWGLLLNIVAIETRGSDEDGVTGIREDAPPLCIAIGRVASSERATLYQQLHSYPVGTSGKHMAARSHGSKYWIAPARRELLIGLDVVLGVRGPVAILDRLDAGLRGELNMGRYGLPFAGDNNLLFDYLEIMSDPIEACWFTVVEETTPPTTETCRLSVSIDRLDSSRSRSRLFAPSLPALVPPDGAWTWTPREP